MAKEVNTLSIFKKHEHFLIAINAKEYDEFSTEWEEIIRVYQMYFSLVSEYFVTIFLTKNATFEICIEAENITYIEKKNIKSVEEIVDLILLFTSQIPMN